MATHYNIHSNICGAVFQNEYVQRDTKSRHNELHSIEKNAPTTVMLEESLTQKKLEKFFGQRSSHKRTKAGTRMRTRGQ